MTKFDDMFAEYLIQKQSKPDVFEYDLKSESTNLKEKDVIKLNEDTIKDIFEELGINMHLSTVGWGELRPERRGNFHEWNGQSIDIGKNNKEFIEKATADANAIINLLRELGYCEIPIGPVLKLVGLY